MPIVAVGTSSGGLSMRRPGRHAGRLAGRPAARPDREAARPDRGRDVGAATVEFVLLTTLAAGAALGIAALAGAQVEQPLETITTVLSGLAGSNG
jgi:hypothetical protein